MRNMTTIFSKQYLLMRALIMWLEATDYLQMTWSNIACCLLPMVISYICLEIMFDNA